ncbi:hypothetical protein VIBRN418_17093 [Vibrio sp. N418]|nr:hypothetical protein VIBRN418_17093 [Vibrio sp. N418]
MEAIDSLNTIFLLVNLMMYFITFDQLYLQEQFQEGMVFLLFIIHYHALEKIIRKSCSWMLM